MRKNILKYMYMKEIFLNAFAPCAISRMITVIVVVAASQDLTGTPVPVESVRVYSSCDTGMIRTGYYILVRYIQVLLTIVIVREFHKQFEVGLCRSTH